MPFVVQAQADDRPVFRAIALEQEPIFDGNVQEDPVWTSFEPAGNFIQNMPDTGESASKDTQFYVGFTDEALYVAFTCHEDDMNKMNVSNNGWESDSVFVVFDTFQNHINAFGFSTNPAGAEWDSTLANGRADWNWSTVWRVKTHHHADSWDVEMIIPFTSLNYPNKPQQDWGMNVARVIVGNNEVSHWASVPQQFSTYRLALAGTLEGLKPPPQKRNIKFTPYALTSQGETNAAAEESENDWGFDIRYAITPTLDLDATYNTDFAQVENDALRVNTGRFSLFFPETRPFFLEKQQLFTVGVPQETLLFHSRAIGIGQGGERLPIEGGLKLAGNLGMKNQIGLLQMRAESATFDGSEDFTVARFNRDFASRSKFGFLFTNRSNVESNFQTLGADFQLGIGEYGEIRTFAAVTNSDEELDRTDEYAYAVYGRYDSEKWQSSTSYHEVGSGFNPAVGYAQRTNSRKMHLSTMRVTDLDGEWGLQDWRPNAQYVGYWDFDGYKESSSLLVDNWFRWKSGADIWTAYSINDEGVRYPFTIAGHQIEPGEYSARNLLIGLNSPQNTKWRIGGNVNVGEYFDGDGDSIGIWASYTLNEHFNAFLNFNRTEVYFEDTESDLSWDVSQLGLAFSVTPKIGFTTLLQYNSVGDVYSTNLRFSWLRSARSGLYLVYNQFEENNVMGPVERETVILKYSHLFDINI